MSEYQNNHEIGGDDEIGLRRRILYRLRRGRLQFYCDDL